MHPSTTKAHEKIREQIAEQTAEFLKNGGTIEEVPIGVTKGSPTGNVYGVFDAETYYAEEQDDD